MGGELAQPTASVPAEREDVEEVQRAEHQQHQADLEGELLHRLGGGPDRIGVLHRHRDVAEVEQVETDHEQAVDRPGQPFVGEHLLEEDLSVAGQCPGHPDGQPDADRQVDQVHPDLRVHSPTLLEHVQVRPGQRRA
ncbi:hypothetical protein [Micromonospora sp. CPCC 205561]|uniref:hypothetical protein n=1 Tax=Micromonospora sp. CPCC 205561 TaxID=3122407 RepID=UPI002FF2BE57